MIALRQLAEQDAPYLVSALNDPSVTQFLSSKIPQPYSQADANWFINIGSQDNAIVKAISHKQEFCGVIGIYLQQDEYAHSAELGYWLMPTYWRQGIATTAVSMFCDFVFTTTAIHRVYNPVSSPNLASKRVMEKSGFALEGIHQMAVRHRGEFIDEHVYAKLKSKD